MTAKIIQFPGPPRAEAERERRERLDDSIKKVNELIAEMRKGIQQ